MTTASAYQVLLMLEGCRKQHRLSQLQLYDHFYGYGMGVSLRFAKSREEAEEILNDAFMKVFRKIHQFDPEQPFKPWFRKILIRTAIDYFRKFHEGEPGSTELEEHHTGQTLNDALDQLAYEEVITCLQQLPPAYRMVFNLYVVDGLTHPEIAKELGITVGTSKSNLSKARKKLQEILIPAHELSPNPEENEQKRTRF